jgi:cbb3-type cytochrome oxidase maturation protein
MLSVLILLALVVLGAAIWALFWAIRNRQFDNLDSQAWNVVLDDDSRPPPEAARDRGDGEP